MGLFSKILTKLGIKKDKAEAAPATTPKQSSAPAAATKGGVGSAPAPAKQPQSSYKPSAQAMDAMPKVKPEATAPMEMVDVMSKLATMAEGTKLDWKVSIVDLLKVLDLDSSLAARKELATELGCPAEVMADNEKMNVWLHKTVLAEIAKNGGNIPKELLD